MTAANVIAHWRKGAGDSLRLAKRAHEDGSYALALFHCHLAIEKALKAQSMEEKQIEPRPTHNLVLLAEEIRRPWTQEERRQLDYLTQYAVAARYDDPPWAQREATQDNSAHWIALAGTFLSSLLP